MRNENNMENLGWVSRGLIALTVILVVLSMIPILVNHYRIAEFVETGPISDTVGNLANPFINIASIAMMFLAFYMQYRANKLVIKQFERSQFENRFFQLLKMHKENSLDVLESFYMSEKIPEDRRRKSFEFLVDTINDDFRKLTLPGKEDVDHKETFIRLWESYQAECLDHYFRQLFMLVRFVVAKDFLTYEQKRGYLRIVRSALSTYEQIFLYYNWLSGDGIKWEDGTDKYFTDYRMIHNINPRLLIPEFDIREMSPFKELMASEDYMKENDGRPDKLFEFETSTRYQLEP